MQAMKLMMAAAALVVPAAVAAAAPIAVPNFSFETPSGATPFGVTTAIDNWTTYGDAPFDTGGGPRSSGTGAFPNTNPDGSVNFSNATGAQVAYVFSKSSIPTNRDGLEQILSATYAAGQTYTLRIDVGPAGAAPGATEPFTFDLFYVNPAAPGSPGARTALGGRTIFNGGSTALTPGRLTEFAVTVPALAANNPAVGRAIGIEIFTALGSDTTAAAGRNYDFDNVRLDVVPEPTGAALAAAAGVMALGRRGRPSPGRP